MISPSKNALFSGACKYLKGFCRKSGFWVCFLLSVNIVIFSDAHKAASKPVYKAHGGANRWAVTMAIKVIAVGFTAVTGFKDGEVGTTLDFLEVSVIG